MFNIGPTELIVILIIALIVFGPRRLPEIGRSVGRSLREFRRASNQIRDDLDLGLDDDYEPPRASSPSPGSVSVPVETPGGSRSGAGPSPTEGSGDVPGPGSPS